MTGTAALVWFKRDLRVRDLAPLAEAMCFDSATGQVVIEPQWLAGPECDPRHVGFLLDCVAELQHGLAERGLPLLVRSGSMPQVLQALRRKFAFTHLFSHEESGPGWSHASDLALAEWCRSQRVNWTESPQTGVLRRLGSRTGWVGREAWAKANAIQHKHGSRKVHCHPQRPLSAVRGPCRIAKAGCSGQPRFQHATMTRSS